MATQWRFHNPLIGIVQGTTNTTRIGNKIRVQRIEYNVMTFPFAVSNIGSLCKLMCVHDKLARGTAPTGDTIFITNDMNESRNPNFKNRYTTGPSAMHSMVVLTTNAGTPVSNGPMNMVKLVQKVNKVVEYGSDTATLADIYKDNYALGYIGTVNLCCQLQIDAVVFFTDA